MTGPTIDLRPVADLAHSPTNARTHSDAQVDQIVASLHEFGFTSPILADADGIVAGHGRAMAAAKAYAAGAVLRFPGGDLIPDGMVPVIDVTGWSPDQRRAYMLADNTIALNAGWDESVLIEELLSLRDATFDLNLTGFDAEALYRLLSKGEGATDPEDAPEPPVEPVSRLGDIWIMGDHRLICGSSTDPEDVAAVLAGAKPHLMVTDPPYGVEYDANWRNERDRSNGKPYGARAVGKVENDDQADWRAAWKLFDGDVVYVWHAGLRAREVVESIEVCGFDLRAQIIWAKQQFAIGRGDYHFMHEPCWYAVRKGRKGHWNGDRKQTTVWAIDKPSKSETGHSTQKPIECMKRPIENNSKIGDAVYEPFAGSSTTIIACQMTGRRCYAIELNAAYVDVGVLRWQGYAEAEATLESTGQTFAQVRAERLGE